MLEESIIKRLANVDCIVFDLDGVLLAGTNEAYFECHRYALECAGVKVSKQEQRRRLLQYWSHPHEFQLSLFIDDTATLTAACKAYEERLFSNAFSDRITQIPGAAQTVIELSRMNYKLAIVSGMHHRQIPNSLERVGIEPKTFAACLSGYQLSDDKFQKPHPYMLEAILAELSITPERALYVGDSTVDMQMARAAGVLAGAILTGNMSYADAQEESDLILESMRDLIPAVDAREDVT